MAVAWCSAAPPDSQDARLQVLVGASIARQDGVDGVTWEGGGAMEWGLSALEAHGAWRMAHACRCRSRSPPPGHRFPLGSSGLMLSCIALPNVTLRSPSISLVTTWGRMHGHGAWSCEARQAQMCTAQPRSHQVLGYVADEVPCDEREGGHRAQRNPLSLPHAAPAVARSISQQNNASHAAPKAAAPL
jgi:hypothetical protein